MAHYIWINSEEQQRLEKLLLLTRAQAMADRNELLRLGIAYSHREGFELRRQVVEDVIEQSNYFLSKIRTNNEG